MSVSLAKSTDNVEDTRPVIDQCEGCYGPLGYYLEEGKELADFRINWYVCPTHEQTPDDYFGAYDYPEEY